MTVDDADHHRRAAPRISTIRRSLIVDCRHDLDRRRRGRARIPRGARSGRRFCISIAICPAQRPASNGRHPLPTSPTLRRALRPRRHRRVQAGRRVRPEQRRVGVAPVVDAALARPRGGRRCSTAASPSGSPRAAARRGRAAPQPATFVVAHATPTVVGASRSCAHLGDARLRGRRRARARALSRRNRADRSGRRPHPRRASIVRTRGTSRPKACSSRLRSFAPNSRRCSATRRARRRPPMRLRRHRVPQRAGDGNRRPAGLAALSGLVERVDRRSVAAGRARRLTGDQRRRRTRAARSSTPASSRYAYAAACPRSSAASASTRQSIGSQAAAQRRGSILRASVTCGETDALRRRRAAAQRPR